MTQARPTRFLVVGAGGRNGATGNHAARQLLARELPVRAFVRQADDRADELRALGAEIAVGDIHNFEAVRAALTGVQRRTSRTQSQMAFSRQRRPSPPRENRRACSRC